MLNFANLHLFWVSVIIITALPGPAMLYVIDQTQLHGFNAGIIATIGVELGTLAYVFVTAFGMSALIMHSPQLFMLLQGAGALYLIYLEPVPKSLFFNATDLI